VFSSLLLYNEKKPSTSKDGSALSQRN